MLKLGLPDLLRRSLATTNAVESLFSVVRAIVHNVKRWRDGSMAVRWAGAGALEASRKFRRLKGHRQIPILLEALRSLASEIKVA